MRFTPKYGTKTLRDTLRSIRDLVSRRWMKYNLSDGHGRYCLLGAIQKVEGRFEQKIYTKVRDIVTRNGYDSIAQFNDANSVVKADVLTVLDTVIAKVKS